MLPARNSTQHGQLAEARLRLRRQGETHPSSREGPPERRQEAVRATKTDPGTTCPCSAIWNATAAIRGSLDPGVS